VIAEMKSYNSKLLEIVKLDTKQSRKTKCDISLVYSNAEKVHVRGLGT